MRRLSSRPSSASWTRSLAPSVCMTSSIGVGADGEPVLAGEPDGVGEVVLALGVVVADPRQRLDQELGVEGEDAGVDLARSRAARASRPSPRRSPRRRPRRCARSGRSRTGRPRRRCRMLTARCGRLVLGGEGAQLLALAAAGCRRSPRSRCRVGRAGAPPSPPGRRAPVPSWLSCTASTASGTSSWMCGPTCSRWWPTTATTRVRLDRLDRGQHVADHAAPADRVQHLHGLGLHPGAAAGGEDDRRSGSVARAPRWVDHELPG